MAAGAVVAAMLQIKRAAALATDVPWGQYSVYVITRRARGRGIAAASVNAHSHYHCQSLQLLPSLLTSLPPSFVPSFPLPLLICLTSLLPNFSPCLSPTQLIYLSVLLPPSIATCLPGSLPRAATPSQHTYTHCASRPQPELSPAKTRAPLLSQWRWVAARAQARCRHDRTPVERG